MQRLSQAIMDAIAASGEEDMGAVMGGLGVVAGFIALNSNDADECLAVMTETAQRVISGEVPHS